MSGHSKWHNIKNQKGTADQKRGLNFTKLSNAIIMAVKTSGGLVDPESNFKLRLAIGKAKALNMPKENIIRAIEKGKGKEGENLAEIAYEGFGPMGIAVLILAATDNRQRTVQELKNLFEKAGGNLGSPGSTSYLFQNLGEIIVAKNLPAGRQVGKTAEEMMDQVIDAGALDLEEAGDELIIYTKPADLHAVSEKLKSMNLVVLESELIFKPITTIPIIELADAQKILNFMDEIEDNEGVQHVFANFEISEEILKTI